MNRDNVSVDELDWSIVTVRAINAMHRNGCKTIGQLRTALSEGGSSPIGNHVLDWRNVGIKTHDALAAALTEWDRQEMA